MQNENEKCEQCGITLCDSCIIHVGDATYCLTHWPTTGYWATHNNFRCCICDLPMKECVKTDTDCENTEIDGVIIMKTDTEKKKQAKTDCECECQNAEVIE